jgi:hypothetical protein
MSEQEKIKLEYLHQYSVTEHPQIKGVKVLVKDGLPAKCHKCAPIPTQNMANQIVMSYELCGTNCTKLQVAKEGENVVAIQTCEVQAMKFLVGKYETKPKLEIQRS